MTQHQVIQVVFIQLKMCLASFNCIVNSSGQVSISQNIFLALIAHYRTHPSHRMGEEVKLIGCDICDAFNIINGFRNEADLLKHTKKVHGVVKFTIILI